MVRFLYKIERRLAKVRTKGEEALINKIKELLDSGRTSAKENDNEVT